MLGKGIDLYKHSPQGAENVFFVMCLDTLKDSGEIKPYAFQNKIVLDLVWQKFRCVKMFDLKLLPVV